MEIVKGSEILDKIDNFPYSVIRLTDREKKTIIPFPSKTATLDQRKNQLIKYLDSDSTKSGIYYLQYGTSRNEVHELKFQLKKESETEQPLEESNKNTMHLSDLRDNPTLKEFLDLQIENAQLKVKNEMLADKCTTLENKIEDLEKELEEVEQPLEEENKNGFAWLEDVLPTLGDLYFKNEQEKREIERAKIGLMQMQQQKKIEAERPKRSQDPEDVNVPPTKEGILEFKEQHPELWDQFYENNEQTVDAIMNS